MHLPSAFIHCHLCALTRFCISSEIHWRIDNCVQLDCIIRDLWLGLHQWRTSAVPKIGACSGGELVTPSGAGWGVPSGGTKSSTTEGRLGRESVREVAGYEGRWSLPGCRPEYVLNWHACEEGPRSRLAPDLMQIRCSKGASVWTLRILRITKAKSVAHNFILLPAAMCNLKRVTASPVQLSSFICGNL
ncbi:hypothetical protein HOLleu_32957 [Holothuria leucospilota]|uniref:Uncharacterized protein n=1 Tax=Holothuria leucospilota TaxID=206669 RepID=A0A9Q0YPY2_HOLLE|nr:hypothetical protein HOLleu_32957 [Holothuria leucospilota]